MKRILCPVFPQPGREVEIPADEARHAVQVLRLRTGDTVEVMDGKGNAMAAIIRIRGKNTFLEHPGDEKSRARASSGSSQVLPLRLELAVLKGDAMEWAIEKAVELGVRELLPVMTAHTVVQLDRKGPEAFRERWQKIADQSLKQCGRLEAMTVLAPKNLEELPSEKGQAIRLWCDEADREEAPFLSDYLQGSTLTAPTEIRLLIGPEGGWSALEREILIRSAAQRISLGPWVLRAETAAIFGASCVGAHLRSVKFDKASGKRGD